MKDQHQTHSFAIVLICTGNICRSPTAERLFAAALGPSVAVSSAGTQALVGRPIAPPMARLLAEAGAHSADFAARQVTEGDLRDADLVLTMSLDQRSAVVDIWPGAVRRTFTLRELERLLAVIDPEAIEAVGTADRLRSCIPLAAAGRRQVRDAQTVDDIADPYGQSQERYEVAFGQIDKAVKQVVRVVGYDAR